MTTENITETSVTPPPLDYAKEIEKIRKEKEELAKQLKTKEHEELKKQNDWQRLAKMKEDEAKEWSDKYSSLNKQIIQDQKMNALKNECAKLGLIQAAYEDLSHVDLSEIKIEELLNEYDAIEQEMRNTPEYRLYAFRRKRGMNVA